jgi:RNA polymerase II subunit A-like phosphatase
MDKTIHLGHRLRYPITIVKILKFPGDKVRKQEALLQYSFKWTETVGDHIHDNTWEEERVTITDWDSPVDGEIRQWRVKAGEVVNFDRPCLVVQETCPHDIQFQGLCGRCGKDMTEVNWASEGRDTDRAPINMTHDQTSLTVSETQAQLAEQELQRRLLRQRKLSLVVDLDQTIIHACIEPTIGEWQRDPNNPNYEAVKEVKSFQLNDDGPRGIASGCWYYIKLRPGLEEFLQKVSQMYELHVYTMGTRAYALNIAKLVDPQQKLFGNRVISRDENGNMTAKSLQRLFPVSTNMVVIIDDRGDVWPRNRQNLIKVMPYDFFKGIGDINSSFLPKREELPQAAVPNAAKNVPLQPKRATEATVAANTDKRSALEELVTISGADNPAVTKRQLEEQERTLEKQIKDRPLLHMQNILDKEDENAEKTTTETAEGNKPPSSPPHQRHHLLLDDDYELQYLQQHLTTLHQQYYAEYDRLLARRSSAVPDVGQVLDPLKARVLKGTKIVLSGILPMGTDVRRSEIGLQMANFGAEVRYRVSSDITHLIVGPDSPRTQKVRQAAKFPSIKILHIGWLYETLTKWKQADETPYLVDIHPNDRDGAKPTTEAAASTATTDAEVVSDEDEDEDDEDDTSKAKQNDVRGRPRLQLVSDTGQKRRLDDEPDSEDERVAIDADEEDLVPPELGEGQMSPVDDLGSFDWGQAEEELDEFLGSSDENDDEEDNDVDDDEEDGDGQSTHKETTTNGGTEKGETSRKRKHDDDDDESGASEADSVNGSPSSLAKKQRLAKDRPGSSLRAEYNVDADASLPTPQITGDEGDAPILKGSSQATEPNDDANGADDDDSALDIDEDDLEADLLAEFEADERAEELERNAGELQAGEG